MKKLLLICLSICALIAFVACGNTQPETTGVTPDTTEPNENTGNAFISEEAANILPIKNGAKGVVTIVHDDGDLSTGTFLNQQFQEKQLCGTVAMQAKAVISTSGVKNTAAIAGWQKLFDAGYLDLACHSWTHQFWGITDEAESGVYINNSGVETPFSFKDGNITFETKGAKEALISCFPNETVRAFVKPGFGKYVDENGKKQSISPEAIEIIKENFIGMRMGGRDTHPWSSSSMYNLTSYQVSLKDSLSDWTTKVDKAVDKGQWIIFMFHQIIPDDSVTDKTSTLRVKHSTASDLFTYIASRTESGELWCSYLEDAMMYLVEQKETTGRVVVWKNNINITLNNDLDKSLYDYPLTVLVDVPEDWASVKFTDTNGKVEILTPFQNGDKMSVYANVIPDGYTATLEKAE